MQAGSITRTTSIKKYKKKKKRLGEEVDDQILHVTRGRKNQKEVQNHHTRKEKEKSMGKNSTDRHYCE